MTLYEPFLEVWGEPEVRTEPGVFFTLGESGYFDWQWFESECGCGIYGGNFLHVGTPAVAELSSCLDSWNFILPGDPRRQVLARNGYGDLLLVAPNEQNGDSGLVLSPRRAELAPPHSLANLRSSILFYLTSDPMPPGVPIAGPFVDRELYDRFVAERRGGQALAESEALLPVLPYPLGGKHELDNFQVQDLKSFYSEVGAIYGKAFATSGSS